MLETLSLEALAHYTRGMTTMFFILWTANIYRHRHQNSMMMVMTFAASYITFGFMKDVVFLFTPWVTHPMIEGLVSLIDILCTPFVTAFFLEATSPGIITTKRLLAGVLLFLLPIALYIVIQDALIIQIAFAMSFLFSATGFIFIIYFVMRYDKCIADNYSYTQDISVKWVAGCAIAYFSWLATYYLCFNDTTWVNEVIFDIFSMVIWVVMWRFSRKHQVIIEMLDKKGTAPAGPTRPTAPAAATLPTALSEPTASPEPTYPTYSSEPTDRKKVEKKESFLTHALARKMEEKVYLNPKLSLNDLALSIGTNRSYLSEFLNSQGKSFYDYINDYRIAEACRILDSVRAGERVNMASVATRSGFNSISSFNRYFFKIKEMTPTAYLRLRIIDTT
ncbi:MAG: helix-turn-helix domain-containing protein [Bacteroides sp.]